MKWLQLAAALSMTAVSSYAGMIGDPISSILHTASDGSWSSGGSATVGAGIEFTKTNVFASGTTTLSLNIAASSFTLSFTNTNPGNMFNLGFDGFEFTDLNQNFIAISPVAGGTFPGNTFTSSTVTANTIRIFTNEVLIPGGATWTATWNVTLGAASTPEPASYLPVAFGLAGLAAARRIRR